MEPPIPATRPAAHPADPAVIGTPLPADAHLGRDAEAHPGADAGERTGTNPEASAQAASSAVSTDAASAKKGSTEAAAAGSPSLAGAQGTVAAQGTAAVREAAIEVVGLSRRFGAVTAIDGLNFCVLRGEVAGFLGPNGAGKSTTMRILAGVGRADSGVARVCGFPVARDPARVQSRIGYMPENNPLPESMRVEEYLMLRAALKGLSGRRRRQQVQEAMDTCELSRKAGKRLIGNLSKGFRQRVGVADAILGPPEVIIMDEPTIGLDPHQVIRMRQLIRSLRGRMSILISSHILSEVDAYCDRVIIINQGRIVANDAPDALRAHFLPGARFRIEADGSPERVTGVLQHAAPGITVTGVVGSGGSGGSAVHGPGGTGFHVYEVHAGDPEQPGEVLIGALVNGGQRVRTCARVVPTLEDVFLAATPRGWEQRARTRHGDPEDLPPEDSTPEYASKAAFKAAPEASPEDAIFFRNKPLSPPDKPSSRAPTQPSAASTQTLPASTQTDAEGPNG